MKQAEKAVDGIMTLIDDVYAKRVNPHFAAVQLEAYNTATRIATNQSIHKQYDKRPPKVKFFDSCIKPPMTKEEEVKQAARTLAKSKRK